MDLYGCLLSGTENAKSYQTGIAMETKVEKS
jgi:hypothetical protein